jgi:hypothetical protein
MQGLSGDGHAPGEILARACKSLPRSSPPQYTRSPHGDAAPQLRADFAVHGRQHIVGMHRRADADVRGFVPEQEG